MAVVISSQGDACQLVGSLDDDCLLTDDHHAKAYMFQQARSTRKEKAMQQAQANQAWKDNVATCFACQKEIVGATRDDTKRMYHSECVKCEAQGCENETQDSYFVVEGKLVCNKCADSAKSRCTKADAAPKPICAACGKEVVGEYLTAEGKEYHPECFTCDKCHKALQQFHIKDGQKLCESCHEQSIPQIICFACEKAISGSWSTAMGRTYHLECLNCEVEGCGKNIASAYYVLGEKLMCRECEEKTSAANAGRICKACNELILGEWLTSGQDFFHPKCFTCDACTKELKDSPFTTKNGQRICVPCAKA